MSSILRALKKLDEESTLQKNENESQAGKQIKKTKRLVIRHNTSDLLINKFLLVLLSILVLGVAGWLITQTMGKTGKTKESLPIKRNAEPSIPLTKEADSENSRVSHPIIPEKQVSPAEEIFSRKKNDKLDNKDSKHRKDDAKDVENVEDAEEVNNTKISGLKLTGILWSEIPERRLALLNDIYLKEGEKIKGAVIIRIEKNGVTLQSGTKTWTIGLKK